LTGILNGINERVWNPGTDRFLVNPYNWKRLDDKQLNKVILQRRCKLPNGSGASSIPVIGLINRLVSQKGIDLVIKALPALLKQSVQIVILGSGETRFESRLTQLAKKNPNKLSVHIGYDEELAHLIEGSADMFLMPSRFEPCGLNQLYSLIYGTVPIVRAVGGLADTVIDASEQNLSSGKATGIVFNEAKVDALIQAVERALNLYENSSTWKKLMTTGMRQSFSWETSANQYMALYENLLSRSTDKALLYSSAS